MLTSYSLVLELALQDSPHDDTTVDMSNDLIFHIYFQKEHLHYKADVLEVQTCTFESCSGTRTALKPRALAPHSNFFKREADNNKVNSNFIST